MAYILKREIRLSGPRQRAARPRRNLPEPPIHCDDAIRVLAVLSRMKRRTFLLAGLGAGGALLFGWSLVPPRQRLRASALLPADGGRVLLNGWVAVAPDDQVTLFLPKSEMGQGIHTALAMVLADELECALEQVHIVHPPVDAIYHNLVVGRDALPFPPDDSGHVKRVATWYTDKLLRELGLMVTGGSTSVRDLWAPLRDAGAMARETLRAAAATRWGVDGAVCTVRDGAVHHDGRVLHFGELVQQATPLAPATRWQWKSANAFRLIGHSPPRRDAAAKADGTATFGIDVRRDGMLRAAVAMSPTIGGSLRAFDAEPARAIAGVRAIVPLRGVNGSASGVSVIATHWPVARRALEALSPQWDAGSHATLSSSVLLDALRHEATQPGGRVFRREGDAVGVIAAASSARSPAGATRTLTADYEVPYLAHATMEPPNCTVHVHARGADVWVGTQVPKQARAAVARVLGISPEQVTVHVPYLGGGFGRRLEVDFIGQAAEIARAVPGTPVQVIWSREDDVRHDFYRPACAARLSAALDDDGAVTAFTATIASQEIVRPYGARAEALPARVDVRKATVEGLFDQPYAFASMRVAHRLVTNPVPVGYWRAVGHSHNGFFMECFIDELAALAQVDPLEFRARLLASNPRALAVLQRVAALSDWGQPPAPAADGARVARGIALHRSFGSIVAQVADVSISAADAIRVHRVVCAVDCGLVIHPEGVAQQMESAVVFGLSAALQGEITIDAGRVVEGNFDRYPVLRMADTPLVITHLMPSTEAPAGVGEIGVPPIAPAVANAVSALTGTRLRRLPLRLPRADVAPATGA